MKAAQSAPPAALSSGAEAAEVRKLAHEVRMRLNPHPAGQLALNTAALDDEPLPGLQHKYPETVLFFPCVNSVGLANEAG